jgi:NAD(P) transhydrogenase subunit alpha
MAKSGVSGFALEMIPRITRAQSMDVLSSQSNLAGYRAVLDGLAEFGRAVPMMMTAAGTIPPARALVMGVGVAGLQAIATARRLGAIVSATDVRPATKEQVESLGATFVAVEDEEFQQAQTAGGYAKEMSDAYKKKQAALTAETITQQDLVICTALIPGRPAPLLISADMVKSMKPGAVIVDLAVEAGGNCELAEFGKVVVKHGVTIVGHANFPGRLAESASNLFARNVLNFLSPMIGDDGKTFKIDMEDEIVAGTLICRDGKIVHPSIPKSPAKSAAPKKKAPARGTAKGKGGKSKAKEE